MRTKYGLWSRGVDICAPESSFISWKEICASALEVLNCTKWFIGDGHSIDVLTNAWLSDLPLDW